MYKNIDIDIKLKTIFLRITGDNFRAACKKPPEQVSYSILNIKDTLHSPYGQFLHTLYRGSENRESLHMQQIFLMN